jgi:hypothetical protein
MSAFQVWYMRPEFFRNGILGSRKPDPAKLEVTHVHLMDVEVEPGFVDADQALKHIFGLMQAEDWSPNGEARDLIRSKGLQHTSMSVGDVIVDPQSRAHLAAMFGFDDLGEAPS